MTTEDRSLEIANYVSMLSAVYAEEMQGKSLDTVLLGFSQGASTISRWAVLSGVPFSALVLWGGQFPPDVDHVKAAARLSNKPFMMYLGTQDQYITEEQRAAHIAHLKLQGLHPEVCVYEGEHKLYEAQLIEIEAKLNALL
jgi:predicted esterase